MASATTGRGVRQRLLRARRVLFVELGRRIFRLRPRDPRTARGALEGIGRRAFAAGWPRHQPDLLPLHQHLLQLETALRRAGWDEQRRRRPRPDRG
ncbi:MAG TPA: hypothetical protein VGT06_10610 [Candidatus Methylomirabilis sp.]|nr:hypothetical protein [Candidatus Methylomirabilis sp.]